MLRVCVCDRSVGKQACPHLRDLLMSDFLLNIQSLSLFGWDRVRSREGAAGRCLLHDAHMLKLSPQPHVPLMLGLLKTNSLDSLDSTKSISVPSRVSWAFFSINTLTPARESQYSRHYSWVLTVVLMLWVWLYVATVKLPLNYVWNLNISIFSTKVVLMRSRRQQCMLWIFLKKYIFLMYFILDHCSACLHNSNIQHFRAEK